MRRLMFIVSLGVCFIGLGCEPKAESTPHDRGAEAPPVAPESDSEALALTLTCVTQGAPIPKRTISVESKRGDKGTVRRTEDGLGIDAEVSDADLTALYEVVDGGDFEAFTKAEPADTQAPPMGTDCSLALTSSGRTVNKQYSNRQSFEGEAERGRRGLHRALGELERVLLDKNRDPSMDPQGADPATLTEPPT